MYQSTYAFGPDAPLFDKDAFVSPNLLAWSKLNCTAFIARLLLKKLDLATYLKELNELKNERLFLKSELDLLQQEFCGETADETASPLHLIIRNYSAQLSNLTSRFHSTETGFIRLARMIDVQVRSKLSTLNPNRSPNRCSFKSGTQSDTLIIKNLAQRLAHTIDMYEQLNTKYQQSQTKIEAYERRKWVSHRPTV